MRDTTAQHQAGYPGSVERVYARLPHHPWLVDGMLAVILLAGAANAFGNPAVLPASLVLAGTVAVRRRFPVAACATALAVGALQVGFGIGPTFTDSPLQPTFADVGILILIYTVAAERSRRISLPSLAACVVLFAVAFARYNPGGGNAAQHPATFVVVGVLYLLVPVGAWALGNSVAYRRAYLAALEERALRAERDRDAQAQIAAAAERARIARELHDVVAHNVSVMVVQADGAWYAIDSSPARARDALAAISATGRQALAEMRSLLGVLRSASEPSGGDAAELAPQPGIEQLSGLLEQARATGLPVSFTVEGVPRQLPRGTALTAYRVVQESLTNARKHGGAGVTATVTLRFCDDEVGIIVTDDGRPAAPAADGQGHGLIGMRERVELFGGTVTTGPKPGGGYRVSVTLPVRAAGVAA